MLARCSIQMKNWAWQTLSRSALMRGTQKRTFDKIYQDLESVGASLGFNTGVHRSGFNGRSLAEDLPLLLDLLSESFDSSQLSKSGNGKTARAVAYRSCHPCRRYVGYGFDGF